MTKPENENSRRISVDLPNHLIEKFDKLKKEWGLRARGSVLKRLLEEILDDQEDNIDIMNYNSNETKDLSSTETLNKEDSSYDETKALVLISKSGITQNKQTNVKTSKLNSKIQSINSGIDLPGFVSKKTDRLRNSLRSDLNQQNNNSQLLASVNFKDIEKSKISAYRHWISLYGNPPGETVVEAAMNWLARDIWYQADETDDVAFTWTAANKYMKQYCSSWVTRPASFELIMVIAGVLEDPFATSKLPERMPTLIRRFVNRFKRSRNVTSFETLQSTMTVHGALKLLDLPTSAGSPLTLRLIREAYKVQAMSQHPDAGGCTESMRRINEAYQLLKELYRQKD